MIVNNMVTTEGGHVRDGRDGTVDPRQDQHTPIHASGVN